MELGKMITKTVPLYCIVNKLKPGQDTVTVNF
jgi:hypothetical protein